MTLDPAEAEAPKRVRILVVDDDRGILNSTGVLLQALGIDTVTTAEHEEALALARAHKPDVILHDVLMPGLDIGNALVALRSDPAVAAIPVVLFSATLDLPGRHAMLDVDGFVEKPFRPSDLLAAIATVLEGPRSARPFVGR